MTFANLDVLNFYKELPFNYNESVSGHSEQIVANDLTVSYPMLPSLLRQHQRILEVGCGVGWLALSMAYHYESDVSAIDFNLISNTKSSRNCQLYEPSC